MTPATDEYKFTLLVPESVGVAEFIEFLLGGVGLDIPGLSDIVRTLFFNFRITDLAISCVGTSCIPIGGIEVFGKNT